MPEDAAGSPSPRARGEARGEGRQLSDRPAYLALPPIIGHRGAAARAPENTLAGLRAAKQLGCSWVEFDARLTGDGGLVLCHDPRLERTTDGTGLISGLGLAAVRGCDAGSRFGPQFAGERVPTLEAALLLAAELGLGCNIEIKAEPGRDYATAAAVAATLRRLDDRLPALLVSSFSAAAVAAMQKMVPQVPRGLLFRLVPHGWAVLAARLAVAVIGADYRRLRPHRIARIREAGYQLAAYTVNDPARARLLLGWGVTSVFSDAPDIIAKAGIGHGTAPAAPLRQGTMR